MRRITEQMLDKIIQEQSYDAHFQPIVEIGKQKLLGCEALLRAVYGKEKEAVSPEALFGCAGSKEKICQLDAMSRERALQNYAEKGRESLLFLNFESILVPYYIEHSSELLEELSAVGISHEQVVLELNEKKEIPNETLKTFTKLFQEQGFLIAIDDMGERNSNLNRLSVVQPDIVKIDRQIITNIHLDTYKQIIVRSIADMCRQLGIVIIAEGVECEEEIYTCMSMGIRFYQGYYFSRAVPISNITRTSYWDKAEQIARNYSSVIQDSLSGKCSIRKESIVQKLQKKLQKIDPKKYEEMLKSFIADFKNIECVYLLDQYGKQITETLFNEQVAFKNQYLYSPGRRGEYHSVQSYYYNAMIGDGMVTKSNPYISTATGHNCVTYSCLYSNRDGNQEILCVDFSLD